MNLECISAHVCDFNEELLTLAVLKAKGPERYYTYTALCTARSQRTNSTELIGRTARKVRTAGRHALPTPVSEPGHSRDEADCNSCRDI